MADPEAVLHVMKYQQRLLPERIPMRFFGVALVGHILAWLGLAITADEVATPDPSESDGSRQVAQQGQPRNRPRGERLGRCHQSLVARLLGDREIQLDDRLGLNHGRAFRARRCARRPFIGTD